MQLHLRRRRHRRGIRLASERRGTARCRGTDHHRCPGGKIQPSLTPHGTGRQQGASGPLSTLETRRLHQPAQSSQTADHRRPRGLHRRHEYPQPPPTQLHRQGNSHPRHALFRSRPGRGRPAKDISGGLAFRDRRTTGRAILFPGPRTHGRRACTIHKRRTGQGLPQTGAHHDGGAFMRQKVRTHHDAILHPRPPDDSSPDHHGPARRGRAHYPARPQQPAVYPLGNPGAFMGTSGQRHQGILPAAAVRPYQVVPGG